MNTNLKNILKYFEELTQIPRPTRGEEKVREHLINWAKSNGFNATKDHVGNLLVSVPASKGRENEPIVTFQGHMDIVCEKTPESKIDPSRDPLKLIYDGDWLKADGTTLGADNGIGLAVFMQIAVDKNISRPELELLFTVAEEDGFDGVHGLKPNSLKGKSLINLDAGKEGAFIIASAATQNAQAVLKMSKGKLPSDFEVYNLTLDGACGGHSGVDIAKKRVNAAIALAFSIKDVMDKMSVYVANFDGGTKRNVIPRKAIATVAIPCGKFDDFKSIILNCEKYIVDKYSDDDKPTIVISKSKADLAFSDTDSKKMISLATALPNGVESWSETLENVIEASNNIAILKTEDDGLHIFSLQRGATREGLARITGKFESVCNEFGASEIDIEKNPSSPWPPNPDSKLIKRAASVFKNLFGKDVKLAATHGGLECASIGEKHPDMDIIALGAVIKDLHSPDERLFIPSIEPLYNLLVGILATE